MTTRVLAVAALVLSACSAQPSEEIPAGRYSGSTGSDTAVSVQVAGGTISVNDRKAELSSIEDNRSFVVEKEPEQRATFVDRSRWQCRPVLDGEELRCDVTWADGEREAIELMRE